MTELVLEVTPAQAVEQLERGLGLSRSELAGTLGASPRTVERWSGGAVERWRTGETHPQRGTRRSLAALVALDRRLRETFEDAEAGRAWLHANSRYLGGMTPAYAVRVGRVDRVEAALEALDSGILV